MIAMAAAVDERKSGVRRHEKARFRGRNGRRLFVRRPTRALPLAQFARVRELRES